MDCEKSTLMLIFGIIITFVIGIPLFAFRFASGASNLSLVVPIIISIGGFWLFVTGITCSKQEQNQEEEKKQVEEEGFCSACSVA